MSTTPAKRTRTRTVIAGVAVAVLAALAIPAATAQADDDRVRTQPHGAAHELSYSCDEAGRIQAEADYEASLAATLADPELPLVFTFIDEADAAGEFHGTMGNDVIFGTPNDDFIRAYDGDDYICAFAGNDTIYGDKGDDWIHGGDEPCLLYTSPSPRDS